MFAFTAFGANAFVAESSGDALIEVLFAFGGVPRDDFRSTWQSGHFEGVPRLI